MTLSNNGEDMSYTNISKIEKKVQKSMHLHNTRTQTYEIALRMERYTLKALIKINLFLRWQQKLVSFYKQMKVVVKFKKQKFYTEKNMDMVRY